MAIEMVMPKLGMTMEEGTVAEWLVPDGAAVKPGQMLYRLETEKIEMEIEAEGEGTLHRLAADGAVLPCGAVVAYILAVGEAAPSAGGAAPVPAAAPAPIVATAALAPIAAASGERSPSTPAARKLASDKGIDIGLVSGTGPGGRITEADVSAYRAPVAAAAPPAAPGVEAPASPLARKLAEQLGVNLASVTGTGPGGRITKEDVEAAAAAPKATATTAPRAPVAAPAPAARSAAAAVASSGIVPIRGMRKMIFERMHASLQGMAQLTMGVEVWMDEAVRLRGQMIEEWAPEGVRPSYTDMVIRAVAKAMKQHPRFNSEVREDGIHLLSDIHIGMAVALDEGLVVPVVRHTDRLSLKDIAADTKRLAEGARTGKLGPDDYAGSTFSVSALGMFGVDLFTPIINPPNVAILGVGRIHDGVDWDGDRPVKRPTMTLSLTWDHRVNDGAPAAQFVQTIKALLEAPYRLLV